MSDNPMLTWSFAHEQTPWSATYYVKNRFKKRQRVRRVTEPVASLPTVEQLAGADNLIAAYYEMKSRSGPAPGPDGVTYADLSRGEAADLCRGLSAAVRSGSYRPGPVREVIIPKPGGGRRTLRVGNLADRLVASALNRALGPLWESVFVPFSMGFRPGRGVWRLLAELEAAAARGRRPVLAIDDIRDAFPSVVIADVLADHARYL
jgi:hypothetical protein